MAQKNNSALPVGLGMAAAAAAAAGGAYWLYGAKHSARHRKLAKSWMLKARAEVIEAIENLEDIDKAKYLEVVEAVVKNYAGKGASKDELAHIAKDFKSAWKHIGAPSKKSVKRVAKKAVKKAKRNVSKK